MLRRCVWRPERHEGCANAPVVTSRPRKSRLTSFAEGDFLWNVERWQNRRLVDTRYPIGFRLIQGVGIALLMVCITIPVASPVLGQGAGASIEGTLRDQQGAVLPGATVTLTNEESGVSRTTTTDREGHYRFLALAPGQYRLTAELSGFATAEVGNIAITIGRSVEHDFTMGIQAMEETVTVSGVAPTVDTTKSEVAGVVTQNQIQTLPVNSRQYLNLALLMPGTSQDAGRSFYNNVTVGAGTTTTRTALPWTESATPGPSKASRARTSRRGPSRSSRSTRSDSRPRWAWRRAASSRSSPRAGRTSINGEVFEYYRGKSLNACNKFECAGRRAQAGLQPKPVRSLVRRTHHQGSNALLRVRGAHADRRVLHGQHREARSSIRRWKERSRSRSTATCSSPAWIIKSIRTSSSSSVTDRRGEEDLPRLRRYGSFGIRLPEARLLGGGRPHLGRLATTVERDPFPVRLCRVPGDSRR